MPTIDIRRHGRDILIPYRALAQLAGHTLTEQHLDRLVDRVLPNSTLRDVLAAALDQLLTPAEFDQVHEELLDPFAGQAPPGNPRPATAATPRSWPYCARSRSSTTPNRSSSATPTPRPSAT